VNLDDLIYVGKFWMALLGVGLAAFAIWLIADTAGQASCEIKGGAVVEDDFFNWHCNN
jgi:hypothetical protein